MDKIFGEFLLQVIKVVFYVVILFLAVKLGTNMAKKKNLKENENASKE